jgi:cytochrome P450
MGDWTTIDFFSDQSLSEDPYPYFEHLRSQCPVVELPHHGVVAVTGYDEATQVYRDTETFSSCNSVIGPFAAFPVPLEGDDVGELIAAHRDQLPMHEHMVTMDPPDHTRERALLMRLITPKRLRDNEAFMWRLADQQLDEIVDAGRCEFINAFAQPFALLVVADLLGVPEEDHARFREGFGLSHSPGALESDQQVQGNPLEWLDGWFSSYVEDRRREPRADVLTQLATATYPDGSTPEVAAVVRTATFLFAAGQETTARLLATMLQHLALHPELQEALRADRELIPNFVDEALRLESPVKADFRLARRTTSVGGVDVPAGTPVMLLNGAANRDPGRFECPAELRIDRPNAGAHIAFGRGPHSCPGGPLAKAEARISLERILDRMTDIRLSEEHHGPPGARRFDYEPTWILRGLTNLHLTYTPIADPPANAGATTATAATADGSER